MTSSRSTFGTYSEKAIEWLIRICGVSAIIFVFAIFFFVFQKAVPIFRDERFTFWKFLTSSEWYPTSMRNVRYGTFALIAGTLAVTAGSMIIAVPFGLGAAVFVSEFCTGKVKEILKVIIELLAAIPSIV